MSGLHQRFYQELVDDLEQRRMILPTLPEVALRVREVADDPDSSLADLAAIIATDQALSARLIQVANSPLMRAGRKIDSIEAAVNRLGTRIIRDLAISLVMQQMFQATSDVTDKLLRELWEHSTQVAAIAHTLASQFTRLNPEQALLAGLLHDIGALPIVAKAEEFPELLADEKALNWVIDKLHTRIGGAILRQWSFPEELIAVVENHENLAYDSASADLVDVVIVSNLQSYLGQGTEDSHDFSHVPAFAKLGLGGDINVVEMEETAGSIEETRQLLNM